MKPLIILTACCLAMFCASCRPAAVGYYPQPPYDYDEGYWDDFGEGDFGEGDFGDEDEGGER